MKKIHFIFLLISHFIIRFREKRLRLLIKNKIYLASLILFISAFLIWQSGNISISENIITEGIVNTNTAENIPSPVANLLSDSLVSLDKTGYPQPKMVSGWQVNNDATLYTFKLKSGLFWNDGTKIKSSDIKFNLPDVEVSYPDDSTIVFKLTDSFYPFPALLVNPVFKTGSLTGTGQYTVVEKEQAHGILTKLVLKPAQKNKTASLPKIVVRFYPDEKTIKTAFELGEIEAIIGYSDPLAYENQQSLGIKKINNYNKILAIFYNTKDAILSDKNIRKALSSATPLIEGEERSKTSIPSYSWAFNNEVKDIPAGGKEMAKNYLEKGQLPKDKSITLVTTPNYSKIGEKIVQSWNDLGVSAVLRIESGMPQNFQTLLISESIPSDPDQYALWHSTQKNTNLSKYSSPRVDKDLEDGRKMGDIEKRKEKYLDFQKVLMDDSPATFLYFPKTNVIYRKKAENNLNKIINIQLPTL